VEERIIKDKEPCCVADQFCEAAANFHPSAMPHHIGTCYVRGEHEDREPLLKSIPRDFVIDLEKKEEADEEDDEEEDDEELDEEELDEEEAEEEEEEVISVGKRDLLLGPTRRCKAPEPEEGSEEEDGEEE
jgi:hypothetical protein